MFSYGSSRRTACGVCLRHTCVEKPDQANCPTCRRMIDETNLLELIKDELDE